MATDPTLRGLLLGLCFVFHTASSAQNIIPDGALFSPGGTAAGPTEQGTLNGTEYEFYRADGSGTFQSDPKQSLKDGRGSLDAHWSVECKRDAMTDRVGCHLQKAALWVFVDSKGRTTVSIGNDHYPGSTVAIRIDEGKPFVAPAGRDGDLSPALSSRVVKELLGASVVTTRYMKWPDRSWIDSEDFAFGFAEAYAYVKWAVGVANQKRK